MNRIAGLTGSVPSEDVTPIKFTMYPGRQPVVVAFARALAGDASPEVMTVGVSALSAAKAGFNRPSDWNGAMLLAHAVLVCAKDHDVKVTFLGMSHFISMITKHTFHTENEPAALQAVVAGLALNKWITFDEDKNVVVHVPSDKPENLAWFRNVGATFFDPADPECTDAMRSTLSNHAPVHPLALQIIEDFRCLA